MLTGIVPPFPRPCSRSSKARTRRDGTLAGTKYRAKPPLCHMAYWGRQYTYYVPALAYATPGLKAAGSGSVACNILPSVVPGHAVVLREGLLRTERGRALQCIRMHMTAFGDTLPINLLLARTVPEQERPVAGNGAAGFEPAYIQTAGQLVLWCL